MKPCDELIIGLYCAGWLATGPRGVIVDTMTEAFKVRDLYIAKNQKLCQNQNSKWRNFAMAFILNLVNITDTT